MRQCNWCGRPILPQAPPWRVWCSASCRQKAYRRRRQLLARSFEMRIADAVAREAPQEAEELIALALPSLRPRLRRYLERRLRAHEELQRAIARSQEMLQKQLERWPEVLARWHRATGHVRPRPPSSPLGGGQRPPSPRP